MNRLLRLVYSPTVNYAVDALAVASLVVLTATGAIGLTTWAPLVWSVLIGLVAFRLWRLTAMDSITEPFHGRLRASTHPVVQWFDTLVSCPWCLGFWYATALTWGVWAIAHPYTVIEAAIIMWAASTITGLTAGIDDRLHR